MSSAAEFCVDPELAEIAVRAAEQRREDVTEVPLAVLAAAVGVSRSIVWALIGISRPASASLDFNGRGYPQLSGPRGWCRCCTSRPGDSSLRQPPSESIFAGRRHPWLARLNPGLPGASAPPGSLHATWLVRTTLGLRRGRRWRSTGRRTRPARGRPRPCWLGAMGRTLSIWLTK